MAVEGAYELAYREAVRALDHQRDAVAELRTRAGMLLAAASITVSLLGHETVGAMHPLGWAAILCFALLTTCVLAIVWPHVEWNFDLDPHALLVAKLSADDPELSDLSLDLIAHMGQHWHANSQRFVQVARVFRVAACLLAIQMVLTIIAASTILR